MIRECSRFSSGTAPRRLVRKCDFGSSSRRHGTVAECSGAVCSIAELVHYPSWLKCRFVQDIGNQMRLTTNAAFRAVLTEINRLSRLSHSTLQQRVPASPSPPHSKSQSCLPRPHAIKTKKHKSRSRTPLPLTQIPSADWP